MPSPHDFMQTFPPFARYYGYSVPGRPDVSFENHNLVSRPEVWRRRLCLHGLAVELECNVRALNPVLDRLAEPSGVSELPDGFIPVKGSIAPYSEREVLPCLSGSARRLALHSPWMELYQEDQRFWIVDERWGMTEINLLRG